MKMDPEAGPALYSAPDYMKESMAPEDHLDDSYEEPASNYNDMDPDAAPTSLTGPDALPTSYTGPNAGPTVPEYTTEYTAPDNVPFDSHNGPVFDDIQMATAAAPLPDSTMDGLASMPHEQTQVLLL